MIMSYDRQYSPQNGKDVKELQIDQYMTAVGRVIQSKYWGSMIKD